MSINEHLKGKNQLIDSFDTVRSKPRLEMTYTLYKQKPHKVSNWDRRITMGKDVDGNELLHNMKNSCLFKIIDKSEIGTIIV